VLAFALAEEFIHSPLWTLRLLRRAFSLMVALQPAIPALRQRLLLKSFDPLAQIRLTRKVLKVFLIYYCPIYAFQ